MVAIAALLGVVGNNAWTAWIGDLVPCSVRGRFLARRLIYVNIAGTLASLAAGSALDLLGPRGLRGQTLGALAAAGCAAGVVSVHLLLVQRRAPLRGQERTAGWADGLRAVRNHRTRPLLRYLLAWNAAVGLSAGFFSFHMLANLKMAFLLVAAHAILVAALRIASAPAWGRLVDTCGARPVLAVCSLGISVVPLIWLFATPERLWPIALEAMVSGALWGGHNIAVFDVSIGVSPREGRPFYLAAFATASGVGFALASIVAGLLATALAPPLHAAGSAWNAIHVLFLLSAAARAGAALLAFRIDEPAARSVAELKRAMLDMRPRLPAKPSPASLSL